MSITVSKFHEHLLAADPTEEQQRLYDVFPSRVGFDDGALNEERFEAIVVGTLFLARTAGKVILCAPPQHEKWVLACYNLVADRIFATCRKMQGTSESRIRVAKIYGDLFKKAFVLGRLLQLEEEPQAWTIFGFSKSDPLPNWVIPKLLSV